MPLPTGPFTVHGGCNCRAVRYTITVPAIEERQLHPLIAGRHSSTNDASACRLPFACFDHCNDCRRALGALLPAWICTPAQMVTVTAVLSESALPASASNRQYPDLDSAVPAGKFPRERQDFSSSNSVITRPGLELFAPPLTTDALRTWLRYYESSENRTRTFCGRCGTNLCYNVRPMPESWPEMLDIPLGTIDREDLEREEDGRGWFEPERQLWCGWGVPWLRKAVFGLDGPKHESCVPDVDIKDLKDMPDKTQNEGCGAEAYLPPADNA